MYFLGKQGILREVVGGQKWRDAVGWSQGFSSYWKCGRLGRFDFGITALSLDAVD